MIPNLQRGHDPGGLIGSMIGQGFQQGANLGLQNYFAQAEQQRTQQQQQMKQQQESSALQNVLQQNGGQNANPNTLFHAIMQSPHISQETKKLYAQHAQNQAKIEAQQKAAANKPPPGGISAQPVPPEVSKTIGNILKANSESTADDLALALDEAGIPRTFSNSYIENRRRKEETKGKEQGSKLAAIRGETVPLRKEFSDKGEAARQGIQNKQRLLDLIKTGKIDDPTWAALAQHVPLNLGKRLLSNETVEYKAGLVDEFKDLRNIFQGQTRIKEIELLEDKIADIYLTDDQKEAVLNSRMEALKADIIREEAAAEVEENHPNLGVLQFRKKVEELAKPKLEKLFNKILDDQKAVINSAEKRKSLPLDPNDPDDLKIMQEILKEVGGDKNKAWKLAKEKGYKF